MHTQVVQYYLFVGPSRIDTLYDLISGFPSKRQRSDSIKFILESFLAMRYQEVVGKMPSVAPLPVLDGLPPLGPLQPLADVSRVSPSCILAMYAWFINLVACPRMEGI